MHDGWTPGIQLNGPLACLTLVGCYCFGWHTATAPLTAVSGYLVLALRGMARTLLLKQSCCTCLHQAASACCPRGSLHLELGWPWLGVGHMQPACTALVVVSDP
jgi:hypothetical protein